MILVPIISKVGNQSRGQPVKKNPPYLLDDPCTYNKSFLSQKIPLIYWMTLL